MSWLSISRADFPGSVIASSVATYMTTIPDSPERVSAPEDVPGLADFKGSVGGSGFSEYPALVRGLAGGVVPDKALLPHARTMLSLASREGVSPGDAMPVYLLGRQSLLTMSLPSISRANFPGLVIASSVATYMITSVPAIIFIVFTNPFTITTTFTVPVMLIIGTGVAKASAIRITLNKIGSIMKISYRESCGIRKSL